MNDMEIRDAYKAKFGDVPTLMGLDDAAYQRAIALLQEALRTGKGILDDQDLYEKLGIEMPDEDAVI